MTRRLLFVLALCLTAVLWPRREAHATACSAVCTQYVHSSVFSGHTTSGSLTGVTAGDALHVYACGSFSAGTFAPAVTDAGGATFTVGAINVTTAFSCFIASAPNASAGTHAITVDFGATAVCSNCDTIRAELPGEATSSLQDNWQATTPSGQNAVYGTLSNSALNCPITTTNANDRADYALFQQQGVAPTSTTGWTAGIVVGLWFIYYQTLSASGAQTLTVTTGASSFNNDVTCMANELAGGGGGGALPAGSMLLMGVGK